MPDLFVDTGGWANRFVRTQPHYLLANRVLRRTRASRAKVLTTNFVLVELVSLLTRPLRVPRPALISIIKAIRSAPWVEIVAIGPALEGAAWDMHVPGRAFECWADSHDFNPGGGSNRFDDANQRRPRHAKRTSQ